MEAEFIKIEDVIAIDGLGKDHFQSRILVPHLQVLQPGVNVKKIVLNASGKNLNALLYAPYSPIEFRVTYANPEEGILAPITKTTHRHVWVRMRGRLSEDNVVHECALAYASDLELLYTACFPLGVGFNTDPYITTLASLDHVVYFHDNFRADEWLLFETEAPILRNTRGLALGRIYKQDGTLVASIMQEGVVKLKRGSLEEDFIKNNKL
ncbi:uncharacterized protein VTP21DRAFT_2642 [Calcarisporiella thermophila]|uniref:uncharacterized protein n=1 Tax=Calcarisporiella thermophila TaxID=911321 RepID=UPI0037421FA8